MFLSIGSSTGFVANPTGRERLARTERQLAAPTRASFVGAADSLRRRRAASLLQPSAPADPPSPLQALREAGGLRKALFG